MPNQSKKPCPFTKKILYCGEPDCGDCPIRKDYRRRENDQLADAVKDARKYASSGAE